MIAMTLLPERWLSVALVALPMEGNMLGSALSELRRKYHIALLQFFFFFATGGRYGW